MATTRGFIERIEVGRGGLVRATLVDASTRTVFTVSDIDGDPERFNERLTKVAVLRDAMNRAEPVEVEHGDDDGDSHEIQRVARLTRDELRDVGGLAVVAGLVLDVTVESRNDVEGAGEAHDGARVRLVGLDGELHEAWLDLQVPERLVASEQLRMLRDALASGSLVRLVVLVADEAVHERIVSVQVGAGAARGKPEGHHVLVGFVETLGTVLPDALATVAGSLALVRITTGPELTGVGGSVAPEPFTPEGIALLVPRGSVGYALLEAAVRENVRVRVTHLDLGGAEERGDVTFRPEPAAEEVRAAHRGVAEPNGTAPEDTAAVAGLLLTAELQAPLSSASRPVWVHIDREMLDVGPASDCVPGVPSTSLTPRSLRDLRIPYPAEWVGQGCFNHGVYRFQLLAPAHTTMRIDGEPLCLFPAGEDTDLVVGYACLDGDHVVTVQIAEYTCDTEFDLDVYRVR